MTAARAVDRFVGAPDVLVLVHLVGGSRGPAGDYYTHQRALYERLDRLEAAPVNRAV
ncbi:hypothetical protein [Streptomyces sp. NPDC092370]|uniref:hypothetical protein n=1 Tax=Streptomyces sp. NPDC092370 TaxID=3366016 RepID=UPI0037FF5789